METTGDENNAFNGSLILPTCLHPLHVCKDFESHLSTLTVWMDVNGEVSSATWSTCNTFCTVHSGGSDVNGGVSCMDHLMLVFPPTAVCHIVTSTNARLSTMQGQDNVDIGQDNVDIGELLKFIGLPLIIT